MDKKNHGLKEVTVRLKLKNGATRFPNMVIDDPATARNFAYQLMKDLDREWFLVVNFDTRLHPLNYSVVSVGDLNSALVSCSNTFKSAILSNANSIMVFHNHPSGDVEPSDQDVQVTRRLLEVGKLLGIPLLDHCILGGASYDYYSFLSWHEDWFKDSNIDLKLIRSLYNDDTDKISSVAESTKTYSSDESINSETEYFFTSRSNFMNYLRQASYLVNYSPAESLRFVRHFPQCKAIALKEVWDQIGARIKDDEKPFVFVDDSNIRKEYFELSQISENQRSLFEKRFLWNTEGLNNDEWKEINSKLLQEHPELPQDSSMSEYDVVKIKVRDLYMAHFSELGLQDLSPEDLVAVQNFVIDSVSWSITTRLLDDSSLFYSVTDRDIVYLKNKHIFSQSFLAFYKVEGLMSDYIKSSIKTIRIEVKNEGKRKAARDHTHNLGGRSGVEGIRTKKSNLVKGKSTGESAEDAPELSGDDGVFSAVSEGRTADGTELHREGTGGTEGRNAESSGKQRSLGAVDAVSGDRGEGVRGTRNGLSAINNDVSESDTENLSNDSDGYMDTDDAEASRLLHSVSQKDFESYFFEKWNLNSLVSKYPDHKDLIDGIYKVVLEICTTNEKPNYQVQFSKFKSHDLLDVKKRFLSLTEDHIKYVLDSIIYSNKKIYNPRAYLLTSLYNAYDSFSLYQKSTNRSENVENPHGFEEHHYTKEQLDELEKHLMSFPEPFEDHVNAAKIPDQIVLKKRDENAAFASSWYAVRSSNIDISKDEAKPLALIYDTGEIVWGDNVSDDDKKTIEEKTSDFRINFLKTYNSLSIEEKFELIIRRAPAKIRSFMFSEVEVHGIPKEEVCKRYFSYVVLHEGIEPDPHVSINNSDTKQIENLVKKVSDSSSADRPVLSSSINHDCYALFEYLFKDALNNKPWAYSLYYHIAGRKDISLDHPIGSDTFSLAYCEKSNNSDLLINETEIRFVPDRILETVDILSLKESGNLIYSKDQSFENQKEKSDVEDFFLQWLKTIDAVGYVNTPNLAKKPYEIQDNVSDSDTLSEEESVVDQPVSESDTKSELEDSDTEVPYILSYPDPEEMPSRFSSVKHIVDEMAAHLKEKEMSYLTFFLPENGFYLEIKLGNNNLLSSEETESGMMQWDVTLFRNNFSVTNLVHTMSIKTAAQDKLRKEDLLYTAMYGLGLLDSSYKVVNHYYGNPYSIGEIENGNKIVFRFEQDRYDQDVYDAYRFTDFHSEDGSYHPDLAWVRIFGRIDWMDDSLSEEEKKEIEDKATSLRKEYRKKFDKQSPEIKFEYIRRYASHDIQLTMLNEKKDGLRADEVAERYYNFVLYGEGEQPKPYRKDTETINNNIQNVESENSVSESDTETESAWSNLNPVAVKQHLEENGVLHGEVIDEKKLNQDSFVLAVNNSADNNSVEISQSPAEINSNFRFPNDDVATGTPKVRFKKNVEALRVLARIQDTNSFTDEDKKILSEYSGWGGLSAAFDEKNESWHTEYSTLKELLSDEEYQSARSSVLNAHYTGAQIIHGVYNILSKIGFSGGKILEPSMGTGHFFGLMPESMANRSSLTGVELDNISGQISRILYPSADITIGGFEETHKSNYYDLAVGNVPFGQYGVNDPKFNFLNLNIHNYFFVKALDEVRPGGLVCFLTSRFTMDSKNSKVRKYLAERADLITAIRLPEDAFQDTANTEVISDLLVFKKKDRPMVLNSFPDWVDLGLTADEIPINTYFLNNPDHVFGIFSVKSGAFGKELAVEPYKDRKISELFFGLSVPSVYIEAQTAPVISSDVIHPGAITADPSINNFEYGLVNGKLYFREDNIMYPPADIGAKKTARIKGMIQIAEKMHKVIELQINGADDATLENAQWSLNSVYDDFVSKYGRINDRANSNVYSICSDYFLISGLEVLDSDQRFIRKSDIFSKRTINPRTTVISAKTPHEALIYSLSIKGHVDLDYMNMLLGLGEGGKEKIVDELGDSIFKDPSEFESDYFGDGWVTADEYLSGNVKNKLEIAKLAATSDSRFTKNVNALNAVQPKPLDATEIAVKLGATWIDPKYYHDFLVELFDLHGWQRDNHEVLYEAISGSWKVCGKEDFYSENVAVFNTYGTRARNAAYILEDCLNLKTSKIYDYNGKERHLNEKETRLAQMKQEELKRAFSDWIFKDPDRRKALVDKYNSIFNCIVERKYDGSYLANHLPGINSAIQLRKHQLDAVSRILTNGNTLLAHSVGAGKTFAMIASAMESKRLGLCHKPMFVVPKSLLKQWGRDFLLLYPGANILVADNKSFEKKNRKKFTSRIATGDYDAVIVSNEQFSAIPLSEDLRKSFFTDQIDSAVNAKNEINNSNVDYQQKRFSIRELELFIKKLNTRLTKILEKNSKDDVIPFDHLGIDRLYVDEAHRYKNLFFFSNLSSVPGVNAGSDTERSLDMEMKVSYLNEKTDFSGVVFATGTPVSNSVSECYVMMRYLCPQIMRDLGFNNFDAWATTFGEITNAMELSPEGNGFTIKQRFAKFYNVPELMKLFHTIADIKLADDLHLDVQNYTRHEVIVPPTEKQVEMMKKLSARAKIVHRGGVDSSEDNMLKITTDGRKIGLDPRIIEPDSFDDPESKINVAVNNIFEIWSDTQADRLTQLVFCDFSTPKSDGFNVYDDMREKLISRGVPKDEIAFIHDANTDQKKDALFEKVRAGTVRIMFGSTQKMGEGVNVQNRLIAIHHIDAPWKPSDMEQREGRIVRQGNMNSNVHIYTYATDRTFDSYLYQTLLRKQKFIGQIMTNKSTSREMEDMDERAMNYAEIMSATAGSPELKEKLQLDMDLADMRMLRSAFYRNKMDLQDKIKFVIPDSIRNTENTIKNLKADIKTADANPLPVFADSDEDDLESFAGVIFRGDKYKRLSDVSKALSLWRESHFPVVFEEIGEYRGFTIFARDNGFDDYDVKLEGAGDYTTNLGKNASAFFARLDKIIGDFSSELSAANDRLENLKISLEKSKEDAEKPYPDEEKYQSMERRLAELNVKLSLNDDTEDGLIDSDEKTVINSSPEAVNFHSEQESQYVAEDTLEPRFTDKSPDENTDDEQEEFIKHSRPTL